MKSFNNKTIRSDDVKVKLFSGYPSSSLERDINNWLESNSVEIVSIEYTSEGTNIRAFILYKK